MTQTKNKTQWRIPATQLAKAAGKTDPEIAALNRIYIIADFAQVEDTFSLVLETVNAGGPGIGGAVYEVVPKEIIIFTTSEVLQFLNNAGETLPSNPEVFYLPKGIHGNAEDEVVVTDGTVLGRI